MIRTLELDEHAQALLDRDGRSSWQGSVSPDGDKIAFPALSNDGPQLSFGIEIFSRSSGESRVITGFSTPGGITLTWSADSRYVFFRGSQDAVPNPELGWSCQALASASCHLFRISAADGSVHDLMTVPQGIENIRVSPDGRHIALYTGELRQEIWRMTFNGGS